MWTDALLDEWERVTRIAAGKRRPPMTPFAIVEALDRAGVREFASQVRPNLA